MSTIQKIIIGDTTLALLKLVFDHRVAQESTEEALNTLSRAMQIRDLKAQILSFVKRNPNSNFEIMVPERLTDKTTVIMFNNYDDNDTDATSYIIKIAETFDKAQIIQRVKIGKDITLTIKAE